MVKNIQNCNKALQKEIVWCFLKLKGSELKIDASKNYKNFGARNQV